MKSARTAFVALSLVALPVFGQATANTRVPAKMFTLVNATSDSVTAVAVSADSAAATIDVGLGEPVHRVPIADSVGYNTWKIRC